jgi:hypothetical protein
VPESGVKALMVIQSFSFHKLYVVLTMDAEPAITKPRPFRVHIPDEQLDRLKRKLEDYELPESDIIEDAGWSYGVSLEWVKSLKKYWLEKFDWRKAESAINRFVFGLLPLN